jgi:hypothetical protein
MDLWITTLFTTYDPHDYTILWQRFYLHTPRSFWIILGHHSHFSHLSILRFCLLSNSGEGGHSKLRHRASFLRTARKEAPQYLATKTRLQKSNSPLPFGMQKHRRTASKRVSHSPLSEASADDFPEHRYFTQYALHPYTSPRIPSDSPVGSTERRLLRTPILRFAIILNYAFIPN